MQLGLGERWSGMSEQRDLLADLREQFAEKELPARLGKILEYFRAWCDSPSETTRKSMLHETHQLSGTCAPLGFGVIGEGMHKINVIMHEKEILSAEKRRDVEQLLMAAFEHAGLSFPEGE